MDDDRSGDRRVEPGREVEVRVGASIGAAATTAAGTDAMKLVDAADALLYELKRDGKDGWRVQSLA